MKVKASQILFLLLCLPMTQCSKGQQNRIGWEGPESVSVESDTLINRKPAFAGSFYPRTRDALMKQLDELVEGAAPNRHFDSIVAIIAPHAGYVYSGTVAASAYNQLSPARKYDNVFILGSSHHMNFSGAALYDCGHFITPLGLARVNLSLTRKLIHDHPSLFRSGQEVHAPEHSIEVQIPFLQRLYKEDLQIVPIILGTQQPAMCRKIAGALKPYLTSRNLFVISTDFSHYPNYADATRTDALTAAAITRNAPAEFISEIQSIDNQYVPGLVTRICGWTSMLTLLDITEKMAGIQYIPIQYMNSGDVPAGEKDRVVGYQALVVTRESVSAGNPETDSIFGFTRREKDQLLRIARNSISHYLAFGGVLKIDERNIPASFLTHAGAFVTLNKNGQLRGCIGQFTADIPLYQVVQEMAIAAAVRDDRFDPVTSDELPRLHVEISVLTPMRKVSSIDEIMLGRHGIYLRKGNRGGTFLPQVAEETGWTREEFLSHCARDKAGIGWDGWKDADIYVYEAYVFGE
jgi:hypothetical protein